MKKSKEIILVISLSIIYIIITGFFALGFPYLSYKFAKVEENTDISKYNNYIGKTANEQYRNKWDMDESIFPEKITDNMEVEDYKMVYYNPWDSQYLSYLVVKYDEEDYEKEVERLKEYNSTSYKGYYGVTGFNKHTLLAMQADSYNGFIYALTDDKNRVIYVELIFCNYFYDLDYKNYISEDYLPDGFDASLDNNYQKEMLKN